MTMQKELPPALRAQKRSEYELEAVTSAVLPSARMHCVVSN